ncbi:hypothetical protein GUJ93_ZPchr0011g27346 [Zizania palustris]|uniref:BLE2 protein n=1 Tax=Zizania palustris TaxID=103762 RepID=A0A8J5WIR4_ZIZPA|nr:hypothetical protein GUJ93_ZPchr0011g27346 [Zizania palustris]
MATGGGGAQRQRRTGGGAEGTLTEMEHVIKAVVTMEVQILTAMKVMAYLAFTWSTVVLLGGYVSSLQRKDFQCLTVITVIEAIIIFTDTYAGPNICIGLSSWRLWHRAYAVASNGEEASIANLTTGLDFFYALVLCQCSLYYLMGHTSRTAERDAERTSRLLSLVSYAVGLLDSESPEEYLSAARMLDWLIKNGQDASTLILGSRRKVQRLLDTLGITRGSTELRLLAARIVVDLAGGIRLAQFPGSLCCVSSLLEAADKPCCINPPSDKLDNLLQKSMAYMNNMVSRINGKPDDKGLVGSSSCCDEFIVQGLTILQRLTHDPHNCADICQDLGVSNSVYPGHSIFNDSEAGGMLKLNPWNTSSGTFYVTNSRLLNQFLKYREAASWTHLLVQVVFFLPHILDIFYTCSPFICIGLSSWRLWHRAYAGASNGEASIPNLTTALGFFYVLVLCKGVLYLSLMLFIRLEEVIIFVYQVWGENISREKWFNKIVKAYLKDSREICTKDIAVVEQVSLVSYAVGLLESGSQEEYLSSARMVDWLIKNGQDASTLILGSRRKAQRLLDTLGSTKGSTELRLLAARIVADLAGGVRLAQFPGSLRCISSLLEATDQPYCTNPHSYVNWNPLERTKRVIIAAKKMMLRRSHDSSDKGLVGSCCCDELIVQGLTILQRLARDPHNCKDICQDLGVVTKITAPIHSHTLIHDMAMNPSWADITNCSLRLVHQLIHGKADRRLGLQISSNKQAITNLEGILDVGSHQLQMRAMEILSELVLDSSLNINKDTTEHLVRKQLQIFLADGGEQDEEMLLSKNNIRYRAMSAQILKNLCIHCKEHVSKEGESLLPKVLAEILATKSKTKTKPKPFRILEAFHNLIDEISSEGNDIEMQLPRHTGHKASDQVNEDDMKGLQEALLSLTFVIVHKELIHSDNFAKAVHENAPDGALVEKLKAIVDDNCNCQATPVSLKIVKLCCKISESVFAMRDYCTGCTLFSATGRGIDDTVRPLLSDLEEQLKKSDA